MFLILFRKFSLNYPICFWIWLIDFHFYLHIVFTLTSIDIKKATFLDLYFSKKFGGPSVHGDRIGWGLTAVCPERPMNWGPIVWDQMSGEHMRLKPNVLQSLYQPVKISILTWIWLNWLIFIFVCILYSYLYQFIFCNTKNVAKVENWF